MSDQRLISDPPDICLMLRIHAEQLWLTSEVLPTVRQLARPGRVPEEHLGAALAYLEVLWLEACQRAVETDAARAALDRGQPERDPVLYEKARRYHAAVRRLRAVIRPRVAALTGLPERPAGEPERPAGEPGRPSGEHEHASS
ncbi:MAG TPA: hypothetical protein VGY13_08345 [Solirubrobacteraceae bacterium]|jgi:hypothetical protein|nr:hypothetical protein [Solirubrobacteraceae bacterium]